MAWQIFWAIRVTGQQVDLENKRYCYIYSSIKLKEVNKGQVYKTYNWIIQTDIPQNNVAIMLATSPVSRESAVVSTNWWVGPAGDQLAVLWLRSPYPLSI